MKERMYRWMHRWFSSGGVLAYHGIVDRSVSPVLHATEECLRAQLTFLRDQFRVIPLRELLDRIERRRSIAGCVAITFDDAYAGIRQLAVPILRSLDLTATVFVVLEAALAGSRYWWDVAEYTRLHADDAAWRRLLGQLDLGQLGRGEESMSIVRSRVLCRFRGRLSVGPLADADAVGGSLRSLDLRELERLAQDERFDFGAHTVSHPVLPFLPPDEQEMEMRTSHRALSERLTRVHAMIAYPYGLFDRSTVKAARRAGMRAGLTVEGHAPGRWQDPMTVPRIAASEVTAVASLGLRLNTGMRMAIIARKGGFFPRVPRDPSERSHAGHRGD